ncbi:DNA-binding transcriptional regulator, XRE family [Lacrimispora sphenoides]|uniref:helix-turn-helix domain-containing protein n=1 Tax=Lacrimispora sphenoides TaxID=29370 RepID=UPI0004497D71|nr:helix-turn-helix domain-containing protein [Lacrimispora sphenoides]EXG87814.1 putative transcriptional regulator [Clostridium sp. ASBs410]SEU08908.1 DNA-binding transcriptional regulator, XRE family [Lacrimispora sphenoides]
MITYYKLLDMLNRQGMTREQLKNAAGLSSATMTKISKQESVTLKTIDSICRVMKCQPGDILQYNDMTYDDYAILQKEKQLKNRENL